MSHPDYETALLLKPAIVGRRTDFLDGVLAAAAEVLQANGEIDAGLKAPEITGREPEYWFDLKV